MKLLILGASRGIGRSLTELALADGHQVTAFVRNPASLDVNQALLSVVRGDVTSAASVEQSLKGHEMVFLTVGVANYRAPTTLYSVAVRNIAKAMSTQGVGRLMFLSHFCLLSEKTPDFLTASEVFLTKLFIRAALQDQQRALDELQKYAWEWMAVRPMRLTNGERTGRYRIAVEGVPRGGTHISRADVADFMLRQVRNNEYVHKMPAIAY